MESAPGTVEGNLLECTPPLAGLSPGAQADICKEFAYFWPSQDEQGDPIQVDDIMEAQDVLFEGNPTPIVSDSQMEVLLNIVDGLPPVEQPMKQEEQEHAETLYNGPPATNVYEGDYGFDVRCPNQAKSTKSVTWTYADHWRKLYASMNTACPFHIHVNKKPPPGTVVRVMAVYSEPEDAMEVVKRCMVHASPDNNQGDVVAPPTHFVRCDSPNSKYHQHPVTCRHSLTVLYEEPQAGLSFMQCLLRFMCLSSCASGMRRRAVKLVWTLENSGSVLGRQAIDLKVSACPGRDRNSEEKTAARQLGSGILEPAPVAQPAIHAATTSYGQPWRRKRALMEGTNAVTGGPSKSRKIDAEEEREYTLLCSSREIYDMLKLIHDSLLALKYTTPALFRAHLRKCQEQRVSVKQEPADAVSSGESQE